MDTTIKKVKMSVKPRITDALEIISRQIPHDNFTKFQKHLQFQNFIRDSHDLFAYFRMVKVKPERFYTFHTKHQSHVTQKNVLASVRRAVELPEISQHIEEDEMREIVTSLTEAISKCNKGEVYPVTSYISRDPTIELEMENKEQEEGEMYEESESDAGTVTEGEAAVEDVKKEEVVSEYLPSEIDMEDLEDESLLDVETLTEPDEMVNEEAKQKQESKKVNEGKRKRKVEKDVRSKSLIKPEDKKIEKTEVTELTQKIKKLEEKLRYVYGMYELADTNNTKEMKAIIKQLIFHDV